MRSAIVVRHGEIDRFHALLVFLLVHGAVRAPDRMARFHAQPRFQWVDEGLEEIHEQRMRAPDHSAHVLIHQRGEHDRLPIAVRSLGFDAREAVLGFLGAVDEGQRDLVELDPFKLGQQAVAEHLRRNARAIGNEEHRAALRHG